MLEKIISGGQTGVDRAALDTAIANRIAHGGWCPKGRKAEDGVIGTDYSLRETDNDDYRRRTEWNVRDSDATLILCAGPPIGGTALTIEFARTYHKPVYVLDIDEQHDVTALITWLHGNRIRILNVAGPRESNYKGIYDKARRLLQRLIDETG